MARSTRSTTPAVAAEEVRPPVRRERKRKGGQIADKFELPPAMLADFKARGMSVEWKRETTLGAGDASYDVFLREQQWDPVPADRYPDFVLSGESVIRRDGMILMERPIYLTEEAKQEDRENAKAAVRIKEQQVKGAGKGEFQRHRADGSSTVSIQRTVERGMPIE